MKTQHVYGITAILVVFLVVLGAYKLYNNTTRSDRVNTDSSIQLISPVEFDELITTRDVFVLDVHTPEQTHIPGTDAFIPYNEIEQYSDQLPVDKQTPIAVYCRSGSMSATASEILQSMGYTTIYDLKGGTDAYKQAHTSIAVEPQSHDFGTVVYGDIPTQEFTLTNYTSEELVITKVSTSCGCTTADLVPMTLDPYESTTFTVSFNPAIHGDDTDLGSLTRTIYIDTNREDFEQITADIHAYVVKNESE